MSTQPALLAWLAGCIDEDEAAADEIHNGLDCASCGPMPFPCTCGVPARMRREVAAKRAVLSAYAEVAGMDRDDPEPEFAYGRAAGLGEAVRALAEVYSDRPGYAEAIR